MHLLDTNILTAFYLGNPKVLTALGKLEDSQVAITIVTKVELLRGRIDYLLKTERGEAVLRAQALLWKTEQRLKQIEIIPFDTLTARSFSLVFLKLVRRYV
jgi:tRNA(fMet)-specific endonuclease VapC